MALTQEQMNIVHEPHAKGDLVKVIAFAGTGKTTTLVHLAQQLAIDHPDWKLLYLAFNKTIQTEAAGKFPRNTIAKTTHSLAYAAIGAKYRNKLIPDLRVREVADAFDLSPKYYALVRYAIDSLKNFLNSNQQFFQTAHCPGIEIHHNNRVNKVEVIELSKKIWKRMCDPEDTLVGMVHDGYLKLYQLEKRELPYDVILFDECQDSNPVTTDLVLRQGHALRVLVGDPHQQIYTFRGAVNAFERVEADRTYLLTGSFRFGNCFSNVANILLREYKGEHNELKGLGKEGVLQEIEDGLPHAVLSRTNGGLFDEAADHYRRQRLGFLGGIKGYRFSQIQEVYDLSKGRKSKIRSNYLKRFDDLEELESFADDMQDVELMSLVKTVKKYGNEIPSLINDIQMRTEERLGRAEVLFTTTHKAKGFEFKHVKLKDDYYDFFEEKNKRKFPDAIPRDEINLYYVAVTRAKHQLHLNRKLKRIISYLAKKYDDYALKFN